MGAEVKADRLDVTEREAFLLYADEVKGAFFGKVNQIYNNAGIAHTGDIEICEFRTSRRVIDVDFWGVVNGTRRFLPHLIPATGHVVNVSSLFGIFRCPASRRTTRLKFAVRGFTEALHQEMKVNKHPVAVTTVHPGGMKTTDRPQRHQPATWTPGELAHLVRHKRMANTTPNAPPRSSWRRSARRRPSVPVGPDAKVLDSFHRAHDGLGRVLNASWV